MKKTLLITIVALWASLTNAQTYVNLNATGANDGTSWTDAFTDLHDATFNTLSGEIWVAQGSYSPSKTMAGTVDGDPGRYTFNIKNNVQVYGGFDGTETILSERDPVNNLTTLSGDLGGGLSAYNVVRIDGNSMATIVDGFTISGGYAVLNNFQLGGGIYLTTSNAIIQNCTFTNNRAQWGGAITSHMGGSPQILNCKFSNNSTYQYDGGAIYTEGNVEVANCLFDGNTANRKGGAIYSAHGSNIRITNSTFVNNVANGSYSSLFFVGTNSAATAYVNNCVFFNNSAEGTTTQTAIGYYQLVTLSVVNCILEFGSTQIYAQTQTNVLDGDPLFTDFENGDYSLKCESPAVNAGDDSGLNIPNVDLNQNTRVYGSAIDMGAYENVTNQIGVYADLTTICLGQSVTLNGTCDEAGYTWNNSVIDGVAFYPTSTQTYTCTGTQTGSTEQITITVIDIADEDVYAPSLVCEGSSVNVGITSSIESVNYTLEDGSGNVVDGPIVGTGSGLVFNTGAINTTTTYSVVGQYQPITPSYALEFDGVNDKASTSYVHQSTSNLTIEAWIKPTSATYGRIMSNHLGSGNTLPGNILIDTYNGSYPGTSFRVVFGGAGTAWSQHNAANCLTLNEWNHIAVTFDNGNVIQYVNGVEVSSSTSSFTTVPTAYQPMHLGEDVSLGNLEYFEGQMDEVRFWSTTRTSTELVENKDKCLFGTETGLELYYDFETIGTNTIVDMAGSNDGTLTSNVDYENAWKLRENGFTCSSACSLTMTETATITVGDIFAPVPDVASLPNLEDICEITSLTPPTAQDNCAGALVGTHSETLPIMSNTTIVWSYNDGNGSITTQNQEVIITGVDATTSTVGNTITANESNADGYQWVDCNDGNSPIQNEMAQSFTPAVNGSYAVEVTRGNCTETSACVNITSASIIENEMIQVQIYPNPAKTDITINSDVLVKDISIFDISGTFVKKEYEKSFSIETLATGTYIMVINTDSGIVRKRFIKE